MDMTKLRIGDRYKRVKGEYFKSPKGRFMVVRGLFGSKGFLDLGLKMGRYGYPVNPLTGKTYKEEGFD